jgi:two-component system, NtrC family, response regulator AtoC
MSIEKTRAAIETVKNTAVAADREETARRSLYVFGESMACVPLSEGRTMIVGRGNGSDIVIDAPTVSRSHAAIHVGRTIQVEDLGSANKTRVRGVTVEPGQRVDVLLGDEIQFGRVACMIQGRARSSVALAPASLRTHEYFEARLADECVRGESQRSTRFTIARLCVDSPADAGFDATLAAALTAPEVLAWYGPQQYELLFDTADASDRLDAIRAALAEAGYATRVGTATFPRDGRTPDALIERLDRALSERGDEASTSRDIVVEDPAMHALYKLLSRVAAADVSVLLLGEMGTGKEVFASEIHRRSPRAAKPFRAVNCAAFADTLVEAELFGYEKGAFTGAATARAGLLESAEGGTVFFDEVGELPPTVQAKLLRAIEERKVRRVGAVDERPIDVRFVAATNRDLERAVDSGGFRGDLFFRLNGFSLQIPPLRERVGEIIPLATRFLTIAAEKAARTTPTLSREAAVLLRQHRWPGNVRELRNEMTRALILADGAVINPEHLSVSKLRAVSRARTNDAEATDALRTLAEVKADAERDHVRRVLDHCQHNQTRAAEVLGISRSQIVNLIERYDLPRPRGRG